MKVEQPDLVELSTGALTREALKTLVRELMIEVLWELEQEMPDPDIGLTLRPEIAARLRRARQERPPLKSLATVKKELGLTDE